MMRAMKACGIAQGVTGALLITLFAFAGCGQSKPADAPTGGTDAPATGGDAPAAGDPTDPVDTPEGAEGSEGAEAGESAGTGGDTETRTTELIQKTIVNQRKPFRDCYEKAKKDLPTLQGTLTLTFTLDPEGKVKSAELNQDRSDLKSPVVVDCAVAELKKIKFPPSSRGMETTVNYPFNFKP
jgi:hypothetical protein